MLKYYRTLSSQYKPTTANMERSIPGLEQVCLIINPIASFGNVSSNNIIIRRIVIMAKMSSVKQRLVVVVVVDSPVVLLSSW